MNSLIANKDIRELACGDNFAYVLHDGGMFLPTEYKVLQSQSDGCFVRCMKMLYNGQIQLYYMTQELKSFAAMIPAMDADRFVTIVSNLFASILAVKSNGFLSCQNVDISFDKIYVDPATYKVRLVYLPVSQRLYEDYASFENEMRSALVRLLDEAAALASPQTAQLSADLSSGTLTLEDVYSRMKDGKGIRGTAQPAAPGGTLRLVAVNGPSRLELPVTKDDFVIGKKAELCDGVVSFNKMISRTHCKICRRNGQYTITDLQSANGTYVNRVRLQPGRPQPVKNGDMVRLANSDFQILID